VADIYPPTRASALDLAESSPIQDRQPQPGQPGHEHAGHRNRILRLLPEVEYAWARPHLSRVQVRTGAVLAAPGEVLPDVYFPETCVASLVSRTADGAVEVGAVGNEGLVGVNVFLDADAVPTEIRWQIGGEASRIPGAVFAEGARSHPVLHQVLCRYTHALLAQVAQTAACNAVHTVEQRCARWLLMMHDRVDGAGSFELTHEFIASLLCVRRASVTVAATALQRRGLIRCTRGRIAVLDRAGLERAACECPGVMRAHLERALAGIQA
jgi:CRP-like cAMP-binding protein